MYDDDHDWSCPKIPFIMHAANYLRFICVWTLFRIFLGINGSDDDEDDVEKYCGFVYPRSVKCICSNRVADCTGLPELRVLPTFSSADAAYIQTILLAEESPFCAANKPINETVAGYKVLQHPQYRVVCRLKGEDRQKTVFLLRVTRTTPNVELSDYGDNSLDTGTGEQRDDGDDHIEIVISLGSVLGFTLCCFTITCIYFARIRAGLLQQLSDEDVEMQDHGPDTQTGNKVGMMLLLGDGQRDIFADQIDNDLDSSRSGRHARVTSSSSSETSLQSIHADKTAQILTAADVHHLPADVHQNNNNNNIGRVGRPTDAPIDKDRQHLPPRPPPPKKATSKASEEPPPRPPPPNNNNNAQPSAQSNQPRLQSPSKTLHSPVLNQATPASSKSKSMQHTQATPSSSTSKSKQHAKLEQVHRTRSSNNDTNAASAVRRSKRIRERPSSEPAIDPSYFLRSMAAAEAEEQVYTAEQVYRKTAKSNTNKPPPWRP